MASSSSSSGAIMGRVFARATFLPSLALNLLLERVTARTWWNSMDGSVLLGALPFRSMTGELVEKAGVRAVVSMNEDYELRYLSNSDREWQAAGVSFLQLSTTDMFEAPSQDKLRKGVEFILQQQQAFGASSGSPPPQVYVHCKAGRTRSATLVACYLMQVYAMAPAEAVQHMIERRPHVWLGQQQHSAIQLYHQRLMAERGTQAPTSAV